MDVRQSNCECSGSLTSMVIPLGNTFPLIFEYEDNGVVQPLPEGYHLIVGIWNYDNSLVISGSTKDGTIQPTQDDKYKMEIPHEVSMKMTTKVTIEMTIVNSDLTIVRHSSNMVSMVFEPRRNNALIK